ncbi:putative sodium-coupled neutral amino acid transporter 10 [Schistocerca serialis cubense]|uniref:putative sodium-coupled neutral amino acid transporter 10 n=1 Tax=Schistocerca serialis cubense TaxID=2023355 RepID=UPI00214EE72A|nr:putative sodium-coupled neutral amino acid transporter 10 [Schistocerca serialis cubense]
MTSSMGITMTLANSIIGVSVLAMPFCFKQCGIILSIVMLLLSSMLSRYACHYLLKAAIMARRRNFEFLAFHAYGPTGKFLVELCIIGFLMGTCIAFFVVVGDLGPAIVAKTLGVDDSSRLRSSVLVGLALFVVLPLGLLRNVDSLSAISMATIGFYVCLVLKVVVEALPHLLAGDWMEKVHLWRPSGIMQCIPIFSMALSCQTQLFEIYESLYNASLDRMNDVIKAAINMCTGVYICVGFFGYVAFCTQNFTGNILMSFAPTTSSEIFKLGFVLSVAVSFPLVIFPCRASLYSLLFRRAIVYHEGASSHIPENRFKWITIFLVGASLGVGLLIPNIELVLGLVGSTIGVLICVIFPAAAFIRVSPKASSERLAAQAVLFTGVLILFLGTYATLYSASEAASTKLDVPLESGKLLHEGQSGVIKNKLLGKNIAGEVADTLAKAQAAVDPAAAVNNKKPPEELVVPDAKQAAVEAGPPAAEVRREPPVPGARQEPPVPVEPPAAPAEVPVAAPLKAVTAGAPKEEAAPVAAVHMDVAPAAAVEEPPKAEAVAVAGDPGQGQVRAEAAVKVQDKHEESPQRQRVAEDAIRKEDSELAEAQRQADSEKERKEAELLETLARHKQEQEQLLREQKHILHEMKQQHEKLQAAGEGNSPKDQTKNITEKLSKKSKPSADETIKESNAQSNMVKSVDVGMKRTLHEVELNNKAAQSIANPLPAESVKTPNQQALNVVKPSQASAINAPKQIAAESGIAQAGAVNRNTANQKSLETKSKVVVAKAQGEGQKQGSAGAAKHNEEEKSPQIPSAHPGGVQVPSLADIVYSRKAVRPLPADSVVQKNAAEVSSGTVLLDRLKGNVKSGKKDSAGKQTQEEAGSPQEQVAEAHAREKRETEAAAEEGNCDIAEKAASSHLQQSGGTVLAEASVKQPENNGSSMYLPHIAPNKRDNSSTLLSATENSAKPAVVEDVSVPKDPSRESVVKDNKILSIKSPEMEEEVVRKVADNSSNLVLSSDMVTRDFNLRSVSELGISSVTGAPQHMRSYTDVAVEAEKVTGAPFEIKAPQHLSPPDVSLPPSIVDSDDRLSAAGVKPLSRDLKSAKDDEAEDNT